MEYNLIFSTNVFHIIGIDNQLLIKCKEDLQYFKKITSDSYPEGSCNGIIMGYNTWLSMNQKPLQNRINIILTKHHQVEESETVKSFSDLDQAFTWFQENTTGRLFVIGGSEIFSLCFKDYSQYLNRIYITEFYNNFIHPRHNSKLIVPSYYSDYPILTSNEGESQGLVLKDNTYIDSYLKYRFIQRQNPLFINHEETQYLSCLQDILKNGSHIESRNAHVISQFGCKMEFHLQKQFPLLTTKKMPFKTILRELLWFIQGSTNNKKLQENNVHIWDQNASREFLKSRGLSYNEGDLGPIYGFQWRHFGANYMDCYTDYRNQGVDQLQYVIHEIKHNPSSRRIIMSAWNPIDIPKMALPPCHILLQFYVNQEKHELDAQMYQRSGDMFLGVPFNIASYSLLIHIIANITGYKPGRFIHIIGDAHIYQQHIHAVTEQIERQSLLFPTLQITQPIQDINTIDESIFVLNDYVSYPRISAPMIA